MFNRNNKIINSYNYDNMDYIIWDFSFNGRVQSVRTFFIKFINSTGFDIFILITVNKLINKYNIFKNF